MTGVSVRVRRGRLPLLLLAPGLGACFSEAPSGIDDGATLIDAAGPTVQVTAPGGEAFDDLRVVVRRASDLAPVRDAEVRWDVVEGAGARLPAPVSRTDSAGAAAARPTLGAGVGRYRIRARAGDGSVAFDLWALDLPVVDSLPGTARPGDTIRVIGRNFGPLPDLHSVQIANVRARVIGGTPTQLSVEVPACLPEGQASLRVALGSQASALRSLRIAPAAAPDAMPVGKALTLDGGDPGAACRRLPAGTYLMVLGSTGRVSGAFLAAGVRTVADPTASLTSAPPGVGPAAGGVARAGAQDAGAQLRFDAGLREHERALITERRAAARPTPEGPLRAAVPRAGDRRNFNVLLGTGGFRRVTATARWVGPSIALYEDAETPAGSFTDADYEAFGAAFENPIAPTVTSIFGDATDLDRNQRIAVLFTPAVNRLTERQSTDGFVGGFFYGLDLLPDHANSNGGEILYALVPDPDGRFGDPRPREIVLTSVPAILAHELVHLINFGERVIERGSPAGETTWLAEGLAEMGEDRVGDEYAARGDAARAAAFHASNLARASAYLFQASTTSVLTAAGAATLAERGASWLFLRHLAEHYGGDDLLRRLTQTTRTGIDNVEGVTGRPWTTLLLDWAVAVYDGSEPGVTAPLAASPSFRYRQFRPREALASLQPFQLFPRELDGRRAVVSAQMLAGAVATYRLTAPSPWMVAVSSGGVGSPPTGGNVLRVVRLR